MKIQLDPVFCLKNKHNFRESTFQSAFREAQAECNRIIEDQQKELHRLRNSEQKNKKRYYCLNQSFDGS